MGATSLIGPDFPAVSGVFPPTSGATFMPMGYGGNGAFILNPGGGASVLGGPQAMALAASTSLSSSSSTVMASAMPIVHSTAVASSVPSIVGNDPTDDS